MALFRPSSLTHLLGSDPEPARRQRMALETSITPRDPSTFRCSTGEDTEVPVEHRLRDHPRGSHGMAVTPDDAAVGDWTGHCANRLAERCRRGPLAERMAPAPAAHPSPAASVGGHPSVRQVVQGTWFLRAAQGIMDACPPLVGLASGI